MQYIKIGKVQNTHAFCRPFPGAFIGFVFSVKVGAQRLVHERWKNLKRGREQWLALQ